MLLNHPRVHFTYPQEDVWRLLQQQQLQRVLQLQGEHSGSGLLPGFGRELLWSSQARSWVVRYTWDLYDPLMSKRRRKAGRWDGAEIGWPKGPKLWLRKTWSRSEDYYFKFISPDRQWIKSPQNVPASNRANIRTSQHQDEPRLSWANLKILDLS